MTAPAFVASAQAGALLGGDPVCNVPPGTANGDFMLAYGLVAAGSAMTAPAGWTVHPDSFGTQGPLFYRWANSEPASYTFPVSSTGNSFVRIVTYRGVHPTSPWDDADKLAGATGAIALPAVTVTGPDRRLVQMVAKYTNTTFTGPGSAAEQWDAAAPSSGYGNAGGDEIVGSGSTGTRTWTPAAGTTGSIGYIIALAPDDQIVSVNGIDSSVALGSPTLVPGSVTVAPNGIDSSAALGSPTLVPGIATVSPDGIDSSAVLGSPTLIPGEVSVIPDGIDSSAALGDPTLVPGEISVSVDGIDSTAELGEPTIINASILTLEGIDSSAQLGSPTVLIQPVVAGTVFNHETGDPVGAGVEVKLFDDNDVLVDSTTTDAAGAFTFFRPIGDTDLYWTLANYEISGVQYHGVSDRGCPAT